MSKIIVFTVIVFSCFSLKSQIDEPVLITNLDKIADETSGLLFHNTELWTHNDSKGKSKLYSIDTLSGKIIRSVTILNSNNRDWEDICKDDTYAYIGDFGNNSGARDDLKIYKIKLVDLENQDLDSINSEIIEFEYNPNIYSGVFIKRNTTNFDCEAMISYKDSLYLFSKNWSDKKTYLYSLSKCPGKYSISPKDTLNANALICGADFDKISNTLALIGYNKGIPAPSVVFIIKNFEADRFFNGDILKKELSLNGCQTEGIIIKDHNKLWISNEDFLNYNQGLFLITNKLQDKNKQNIYNISPKIVSDKLTITYPCEKQYCKIKIEIFSENKQKIKKKTIKISSNKNQDINVEKLVSGKYFIHVFDKNVHFQSFFTKI